MSTLHVVFKTHLADWVNYSARQLARALAAQLSGHGSFLAGAAQLPARGRRRAGRLAAGQGSHRPPEATRATPAAGAVSAWWSPKLRALWLTSDPLGARAADWRLDKLATRIAPLDVAADGNRHLRATGYSVGLRDQLIIETLDAPQVAPGEPALLDFNQRQPRSGGIHFNLFNNVWGTNFRMWYDEDARFRFVLRF